MPRVFADGGNCVGLPDHTIESVLASVGGGCDGLYVRVHGSQEGEPFLRRDADLSVSTNGRGDIYQTTTQDLLKLDAADRFHANADAPWRRNPQKNYLLQVPALEEVLWWLPLGYPVVVELGAASVAANPGGGAFLRRVVELLARPPAPISPSLAVTDLQTAGPIRAVRPDVPVWLSLETGEDDFPGWDAVEDARIGGLVLPFSGAFISEDDEDLAPSPLLEECAEREDLKLFVQCPPQTALDAAVGILDGLELTYAFVGPDPDPLLAQVRSPRYVLEEPFSGTTPNLKLWKFGFARLDNEDTRIYQDDGLHIVIDEGETYSGAGAVSVFPVRGDFSATVEFTATNPALAGTMELGAINVSASRHYTRVPPRGRGRHDEAFDTHAAAPFVCVENDEADGFRVMNNRASFHFTNRYHRNVGTPGCQEGALRLDRRGSHFTGYYKDAVHSDWIGCGSMVNEALNHTVFLRLAAKHWGKVEPPLPANHVTFRDFEIRLY